MNVRCFLCWRTEVKCSGCGAAVLAKALLPFLIPTRYGRCTRKKPRRIKRMHSMDQDIDHILVSEEQLKQKVAELGAQISRDYEGRDLLLVSILKGSVVFMADLMRAVTIPCGIDFMVV